MEIDANHHSESADTESFAPELSLDPADWREFKALAHAALDDALELVERVRERPIWKPVPAEVKAALSEPVPADSTPLGNVYSEFRKNILPYVNGNIHPRFFGWVHGAGQPGGIIAEMMAAAMNGNCGGRDHGAIYVERQVIDWCRQLFRFPPDSSGLLVSGTSMANLIGLGVARHCQPGDIRRNGVGSNPERFCAYASSESHSSVFKAFEILGLGSGSVRRIEVDDCLRMDLRNLQETMVSDRYNGLTPFCVVASAGTVNTGAIDDLDQIARICADERVWFHVDGAFGGLCVLSDRLRPRVAGIERADSIAFDFHKWAHVQYDAVCILVRNGETHRAAYSDRPPYLESAQRGLAGGGAWPCEFGPELSRGFRALKVWFALKEHGTRKLGHFIERNCSQAEHLRNRIVSETELELMAPVELNIVCFRFRPLGTTSTELDSLNEEIVADLQLSGIAAPSSTRLGGKIAIRVNITNHRTLRADLDVLLDAVLFAGRRRISNSNIEYK